MAATRFDDPWIRDGRPSPLEYHRQQYELTHNPIHVVRGYQICRELMRAGEEGCAALPDWILDYVDHFASTVQDLFGDHVDERRPVPDLSSTLAETLGFKQAGRGVREDAFTAWTRDRRDQQLAGTISRHQREHPGVSVDASVADIVAAELIAGRQVSEKMVWRAWAKWRPPHS